MRSKQHFGLHAWIDKIKQITDVIIEADVHGRVRITVEGITDDPASFYELPSSIPDPRKEKR